MLNLETIIGLEIHLQLKTKSKMFCFCSNDGENQLPNTTVCQICLGHPGTLPIPNELAINLAIKAGLALNCDIASSTKFDRKNYFYPDLPKGYQISQFDEPICKNGFLEIMINETQSKKFHLERLHLEEDAGKNTHNAHSTLVDFNRGGTPLIEIVTKPDFRSPQEAKLFLQELRLLMKYINVSNADMEKGHMRCDANISLRPHSDTKLYPKTEIKNINSFKAVERALEYEIKRQTDLWISGEPPKTQSTRGWDEDTQQTFEQRIKETSDDYRYFPEPDIPKIQIEKYKIENIKSELPELPFTKKIRFIQQYNLQYDYANQIIQNKKLANYFEETISELENWIYELYERTNTKDKEWLENKDDLIKTLCSWLLNKLPTILEKFKITFDEFIVTPENFAELITLIYKKSINNNSALLILEKMTDPTTKDSDPSHIMEEFGLTQIDNQTEIIEIAKKVITQNQEQVTQYKSGKLEVLNFLVGKLMKESKGKANPQIAKEILDELL